MSDDIKAKTKSKKEIELDDECLAHLDECKIEMICKECMLLIQKLELMKDRV